MKNFIKRNHLALSVVAVCVILLVFLYCIGFRITYAPQLENSWDAISAVATWAGVVVSCFAVWAAIQIPQRIAEEQNDVSEKQARMNIYFSIKEFSEDWVFYEEHFAGSLDVVQLVRAGALNFIDEVSYEKHHKAFESYKFYFQKFKEEANQLKNFHTKIYALCQSVQTMPELREKMEPQLMDAMKDFLEFYNSQNFKNMISYMEKKLESIEAQKISS